ncbi:LuxR C-terminal-related transcriptional regulator [Clostridium sp. Cult2]|uniref:LuxR C-terminal-related transcriptional regulator n=1 Tax=Clostridium sp. Cult2 TaxID=2079003 RepID=UPI00235111DD|nr:LuxR C-terminal-related transcriptional regulator [Clostridium sp. Cult2]MCF6466726.1 helix-turn-helix transcriptional regulator [Clostridium sp. Cult2]
MFKNTNKRIISINGFALLFAYLLSFVFEGQVLYSLIAYYDYNPSGYILAAIVAHFIGLFFCGSVVKSPIMARRTMISSMGVCLIVTLPFFFNMPTLWALSLVVSGYAGGCAVASWGYYLKTFTPKNQRIKTCADVLIYSNIIMICINVVAIHLSAFIGLAMSIFCLVVGMFFIWLLPADTNKIWAEEMEDKEPKDIQKSLLMLFLFVATITINSGLMYQVMNPAFEHLTTLVSWYWAVPYIFALIIIRNLPTKVKRSQILYVGMAMIMASFVSFMLLGRGAGDYFVVNTLMLGACGIFDLFWWSIIGEMLDYAKNPVKVFGIGLAANVFGVLCGDMIGVGVTSIQIPSAEVAVMALVVVCVTLAMLPPLNRQLTMLIKNHVYLVAYDSMSKPQQEDIIQKTKVLTPLTERENEVLQLILTGKSNREIGEKLYISESTVKTHVRNIYSKYDVSKRAELISMLLKKHE